MKFNWYQPALFLGCLSLACLLGCTYPEQSSLQGERNDLLLPSLPPEATTIGEAAENIGESDQVVIKAWLDVNSDLTREGKAVVLVREILEDTDHGGVSHDPSTCPFCKRRMDAAPKAAVVFVDDKNKALPFQVDELLPVKQGDIVIIRGTAKPDPLGDIDLKIWADGIFLTQ